MEELYRSYLTFLRSMSQGLENLTDINEKKLAAAQADDLTVLNELLNQEQAQALNFRGLEQARDKVLPRLGLVSVPLGKVPGHFPPALQAEAQEAVTRLQDRYQAYQRAAKKTRAKLEQNLEEVETVIVKMGGPPAEKETGPKYQSETGVEPPPAMRTDFRA